MKKPWEAPSPVRVQLATNPPAETPAWRDISAAVLGSGVSVSRGRPGAFTQAPPSSCGMVVDNSDGQFSDVAGQPVTLFAKRIRVSYRKPSTLGLFNLVPSVRADVEAGDLSSWFNSVFGSPATTLTSSTARAFSGTRSVLVTWPTVAGVGGAAGGVFMPSRLFVIGRTYVVSVPAFVPAGSPAVRWGDAFGSTPIATSTVVGRWQILRVAFVATANDLFFTVSNAAAATAGQQVWVDAVRVDEAAPGQFPATSVDTGRLNMATNPGSETGAWFSNNGAVYPTSVDTTFKRSGSQSTKSTPVTAQSVLASAYNVGGLPQPCSPGDVITAAVYVAHNAAVTAAATVTLSFLDAGLAVVQNFTGTAVSGISGNSQFGGRPFATGTCPAGATQFRVVATVTRSTGTCLAGEFAWLDDCLIEQAGTLGEHFDGATINDHQRLVVPGAGSIVALGSATVTPAVSFGGRSDWTRIDAAVANNGGQILYPAGSFRGSRQYRVDLEIANDTGSTRAQNIDVCDGANDVESLAPGATRIVSVVLTAGSSTDLLPTTYRFLDLAPTTVGSLLVRDVKVTPVASSLSVWTGTPNASASQQFADSFTTVSPTDQASGPAIVDRFTGIITGNSTNWPALGHARSPLRARDRSGRLASRTVTFRTPHQQELLSTVPFAMYPLTEPESATAAGDISTHSRQPLAITGTGTAPTFGTTQATALTPHTGATFPGGAHLRGDMVDGFGFFSGAASLTALLRTTATTQQALAILGDGYGPIWVINTTPAGKAQATWLNTFDWSGTPRPTITGTRTVNDGQPHVVTLTVTLVAGTVTLRLYVDGILDNSAAYGSVPYLPNSTIITAGGGWSELAFTGLIGNIAAHDRALTSTEAADIAAAHLNGFNGEPTQYRLARYARWAGIPDAEIVLDPDVNYAGTMAPIDTDGMAPWDAMTMCETVEGGALHIDGSGRVRFRSRRADYNQAPKATVASTMLRDSLEYVVDPTSIVNDLEGTRPGGATQRVVNQASIDEFERVSDTVTIPAATDQQVADQLAWRIGLMSEPAARAEGVSVRLTQLDDTLTDGFMSIEPGDRLDVITLPAHAPAATDSLAVQGWTETYSHAEGALWSADTTAVTPPVWTIEDPVYGAIDSVAVIAY